MNLPFEETRKLGEATRAIHCGEGVDSETKAIRRPIVLGNSFELNSTSETLAESFDWNDPDAFNYPRSRHPNARYLEERLAGMEGGEDCVVSSSGVAARPRPVRSMNWPIPSTRRLRTPTSPI